MNLVIRIWKTWLMLAKPIGNFQSQLFLSIFYLTIIAPLGFYFHFFSNELDLKVSKNKSVKSVFKKWEHPFENIEEAKRQY